MIDQNAGGFLIDEIKSQKLKPYNRKDVDALKSEITTLNNQMNDIKRIAKDTEISEEMSINYLLLKFRRDRNLRVLKAYHFNRLVMADNIDPFLGEEEQVYVKKYLSIQDEYFSKFPDLDFDVIEPPLSSYIHIYTVKDCGVVVDDGNFIELKKDRIYFIKKKAVEHLIQMKYVNII